MFSMQIKNLNKNLVGNIIIIISLIVVLSTVVLLIMSSFSNSSETVEWNGMKCFVQPDAEYSIEGDSFIMKSPFKTHNLELRKTKDLTNYKDNIQTSSNGVAKSSYNSTHSFIISYKNNYGAIVPTDAIDRQKGDPYNLKDNTEIIEVTGENSDYMQSFIASTTYGM